MIKHTRFATLTEWAIGLMFLGLSDVVAAQDWPQFRGPNGNGVLEKLEHPVEWSNENNLAWSVELPGSGLASPVVHGDLVFLAAAVGAAPSVSFSEGVSDMRPKTPDTPVKFDVICYSLADGTTKWSKTIIEKKPEYPIHGSNSYATETPATDGQRLYVYFAAVGVIAALDFQGNEIWRQDVGAYPTGNGFGTGSSLTIGDGKVFIQCDNDQTSFVVAFDGATGGEIWRKERSGKTSWSTPLFWQNDQRAELVTCGSGFVTSYEPSTGEELWTLTGISSAFSASPAGNKQQIYFGNSGPMSSGPLVSVAAGMSGNHEFDPQGTIAGVPWSKMQAGPGMSSPIVVGDYLYIPGRGILTCYAAKDGTVEFKERMQMASIAASMWAAGDRIFMLDETGKTLVLEAGNEFKVVATNQITDDLFWSTPAIAGNSLLLRGTKRLYCIRQKS
jgi:outer membrane protein assembly factor BamB